MEPVLLAIWNVAQEKPHLCLSAWYGLVAQPPVIHGNRQQMLRQHECWPTGSYRPALTKCHQSKPALDLPFVDLSSSPSILALLHSFAVDVCFLSTACVWPAGLPKAAANGWPAVLGIESIDHLWLNRDVVTCSADGDCLKLLDAAWAPKISTLTITPAPGSFAPLAASVAVSTMLH